MLQRVLASIGSLGDLQRIPFLWCMRRRHVGITVMHDGSIKVTDVSTSTNGSESRQNMDEGFVSDIDSSYPWPSPKH